VGARGCWGERDVATCIQWAVVAQHVDQALCAQSDSKKKCDSKKKKDRVFGKWNVSVCALVLWWHHLDAEVDAIYPCVLEVKVRSEVRRERCVDTLDWLDHSHSRRRWWWLR
jgi:hypothetical protein